VLIFSVFIVLTALDTEVSTFGIDIANVGIDWICHEDNVVSEKKRTVHCCWNNQRLPEEPVPLGRESDTRKEWLDTCTKRTIPTNQDRTLPNRKLGQSRHCKAKTVEYYANVGKHEQNQKRAPRGLPLLLASEKESSSWWNEILYDKD
jgi:hypothetical protein